MDGGHFPNNSKVNIRVVMGDDVSHPSHLSERQFGHFAPRFVAQMRRGFADDFNSPNYGILLLGIQPEFRFRGILDT